MMRRIKTIIVVFGLLLSSIHTISQTAPKQEMRAVWLTTVWGLDWPATTITSTGSSYQINLQKDQLVFLLNKLQSANINTVFFQVRSECDAMYQSSFEPWSSYLVSTRGMDPGYDPLKFAISEAHKRGMELHAWLNPYRFESSVGKYEGKAGDYRQTNPDWVLEYPDKSDGSKNVALLDPGNPEVRQRIVDIVQEIITNYDVDGITFDDYFYAYGGTPSNLDAYTQGLYKPANMSLSDWRRDNINKMVADVYNMIQENKPWITYGLSPFGIWTTDKNVAAAEGIDLPAGITGSNMYEQIYCDPVAWLKEGTVDYISPQLYWPTTSTGQDYDVLGPWWSDISNRFHRHLYVSHSLYGLDPSSYAVTEKSGTKADLAVQLNGLSMLEYHVKSQETNLKSVTTHPSEYGKQIQVNRNSDKNGAPGSVFFRVANFNTPGFVGYLTQNHYKYNAIIPAINWKPAVDRGIPSNIRIENDSLKWDSAEDSVRFVIYAIPNDSVGNSGNLSTPDYILAISYTKNYDLSNETDLIDSHKFAVAVLDRYGNEFPTGLMDYTAGENHSANLTYPINSEEAFVPFNFKWDAIDNAEYYFMEVAADSAFNNILYKRQVDNNEFDGENVEMAFNQKYYWRVTTRMIGVADAVSETESFIHIPEPAPVVTSPTNNSTGVLLTPVINWENFGEGFNYHVQISYNNTFTSLVLDSTNINALTITVPLNILHAYATYYIRVQAGKGETTSAWSETVKISTINEAPDVPVIVSPENGSNVTGPDVTIVIQDETKANGFRMELSGSPTFPWTDRKALTLDAFEYEGTYSGLAGGTYYVRVRASYSNKNTDWSETTSFQVVSTAIDDILGGALALKCQTKIFNQNVPVEIELPASSYVNLVLYDVLGNKVMELINGDLPRGVHSTQLPAASLKSKMYFLTLNTNYGRKTLKIVK